jgi:hypothetical protein
MAWVRVPLIGSEGVNKDLSPHELPPTAWTDARNMRFLEGAAQQAFGWTPVYGSTVVVPQHVRFVRNAAGERFWLYAGAAKIYAASISGVTPVHTDLTRSSGGDYTGGVNAWTSTLLSGIPILNNGQDVPQRWNLSVSSRMANLENWPATTRCAVMRSYKNFLVALNITKNGTRFPYMVKWSHPADPGAVPVTWDETDATKDAGELDLASDTGELVDGLPLRDSFMIYGQRGIWRMDFTGGVAVFRFQKVFGSSGALNRNCIVEVDGVHVVLTRDDVIVHDGQNPRSVLDNVSRRTLFDKIDADNLGACFVTHNPYFREVLVCYPLAGESQPTRALVWNYANKTVAFRDIPRAYSADVGEVDSDTGQTFEDQADPFDAYVGTFSGGSYLNNAQRLVMADATGKLQLMDGSTLYDGALPAAYVERLGLSFGSAESIKCIRSIRPRISGTNGAKVRVRVAGMADHFASPVYSASADFVIGQSVSADVMAAGRYIAIRVEGDSDAYQWRLDSMDVDVVPAGKW